MKSPYSKKYRDHYLNINKVYPSIFALKMFLGMNPDLNLRGENFEDKKILDVGFGDGRDLLLFNQLGFEVFGVEVDKDVVEHTSEKLKNIGVNAFLSVGSNEETGFSNNTFDFVYSSAALMYLRDSSSDIHKILRHVYEIVKPGGTVLGTLARHDTHVVNESTQIDNNRIILKDPFFRQREGQLYWLHNSKEEVLYNLSNAGFSQSQVYEYDADWFGTRETLYMFLAKK